MLPLRPVRSPRRAASAFTSLTAATALGCTMLLGACATSTRASTNASPSGASSMPTADGAPVAGAIDPATAPFVASRRTKKYYPAACHTVTLIRATDRLGFASMKDAETAGFSKELYSTDCRY